ncbi:MAG: LCP family protein [Clostridia bacterium]|nr:LCP family protein [Clostridia bacterium]MBQ2730943.1 LCP family protein [Clostridia bacterium]
MKHSARNFLVVFLVSIVLFSVLAFFLMQYISDMLIPTTISDEGGDPTVTTPETEAVIPTEDSSALSYLILGLDEFGAADYILLNQIDRHASTFLISDLPANLLLDLDAREQMLGDTAKTRDINFVREKVYALTAVEIDYIFCVEADGFVDLVDQFGGFEFDVPCNMNQSEPDRGIQIDLAKGKQHLDGAKALQVLQFSDYETNVGLSRSETFRAMMLAMCRGILTAENNLMRTSEMLPELFCDFTTDMTIEEANGYLDTLFSFDSYTVEEFTYPGKSEGDFYRADIDAALESYKPYRA